MTHEGDELERKYGYVPWLHMDGIRVDRFDARWLLEHGVLPPRPRGSPPRPYDDDLYMAKQKSMSDTQAAQAAIRIVSFRTHRMARGYGHFDISLGPPSAVDLGEVNGVKVGVQSVPSKIDVVAKKTASER